MFKKFTWGHGIIIALVSFMLFILSMIFFFSKDWKNAEMVSNNYYEEELHYQEVIDAKNNAARLGEKPLFQQTSNGINLQFPESAMPDGGVVYFELFRTDDANLDIKKEEQLNGNTGFTIPARVLRTGSYTLKVKWKNNGIAYQVDYDVLWK